METVKNLITVLNQVKNFFQQLDEIDEDDYENRNDYEYWLVTKKNFFNAFDIWIKFYSPQLDNIHRMYDFYEYLYSNLEKFSFEYEEIDELFNLFKNYLVYDLNEKL
jgi:hypothetical protein